MNRCSPALFAFSTAMLLTASMPLAAAVSTTTVTFQDGIDSYSGTFDRKVGVDSANDANGADINTATDGFFLDGPSSEASATDGLLRFDNIIGSGAIPEGAVIIDAEVTVVTTNVSFSGSAGSYNIYQLNTVVGGTTTYASLGGGVGAANSRILGTFDDQDQVGTAVSARVDNAVQAWVNGETNYGFGIRSDYTTDGWSYHTTGVGTAALRPKLSVTYTTATNAVVNTYTPTLDLFPDFASSSNSVNGADVERFFIDGDPVDPYVLRFDDAYLDLSEVIQAELTFVTTDAGFADSSSDYAVFQVTGDWDANTLMSDILAETVAADIVTSSIDQTEVITFDVTSIVENWVAGDGNYGFVIATEGTNGWEVYTSGSSNASFQPELRIVGIDVPEPGSLALLAAGGFLSLRRKRQD